MRFRIQNIKPGYCEIWANVRHRERYQKLAVVMRDESTGGTGKTWTWSAKHNEPPFYMPFFTHEFRTRREAVVDCERWALKKLVERAIAEQAEESPHWHSPRRDAWCEVTNSRLFSHDELKEMKRRLTTFPEVSNA